MSFTKKLLAGFAAMLLLVLVLSATALVVIKDLGENVTQISKVSARQQALAGEISTSAAMMGSVEGSLLIAAILGDRSKVDVAQQEFQDSAAHLRRALQQFQSGGEASSEAVEAIARRQASFIAGHEELSRAVANQQLDAALNVFSASCFPKARRSAARQ
jgi:hypothetical protein